MRLMFIVPTAAVLVSLAATAPTACASDSPDHEDEDRSFLRSGDPSRNSGKVIGVREMQEPNDGDAIKDDRRQRVLDFWTPARIQNAKPRHMAHDIEPSRPALGSKWGNKKEGKREEGGGGGHKRTLQGEQGLVANDQWGSGGEILRSAGRLLFVMKEGDQEYDYLCSATTVFDDTLSTPDHSVLITASHCVYDDVNKEFASNFMFIPNQDGTTGDYSDRNCFNDPMGCWTPSFAVVDNNWATRSWPTNIRYDYAYLVVDNMGNRDGDGITEALDRNVRGMRVSFTPPTMVGTSHALGYSGNKDPDFMYCVQDIEESAPDGGYLLDGCGLQGGSSGGPWIKEMSSNGVGELIAVNSYGPRSGPSYMGGPRLYDNSAECLYEMANTVPEEDANGRGVVVTWGGNCATATFVSGDDFGQSIFR